MKVNVITLNALFLFLSVLTVKTQAQIPQEFTSWKFSSGGYNCTSLLRHDTLFCGSMDGYFYALNAKTGAKFWSFNAEFEINSTCDIVDTVLCFESGGKLFGLNVKNGKLLWKYCATNKLPQKGSPTVYRHSSPVIYKGTAYFGDEWGYLNGINIYNGKLVYQLKVNSPIHSTPAIQNDSIFFGTDNAWLYAFSLTDSAKLWSRLLNIPQWDGSVVSKIVIKDTMLFMGRYCGDFSAISIKTGKAIWSKIDAPTFAPTTPIFWGDYVIYGTTMNSNSIFCLNYKTGVMKWSFKSEALFFATPGILHDSILLMNTIDPFKTDNGTLYFINCNNGKLINDIHLPKATESSPVIFDDLILVGKNDGMYGIKYAPYLTIDKAVHLSFDNSDKFDTVTINKSFSKSYAITNTGNFCDDISTTYEIEGSDSKTNLKVGQLNKVHIAPGASVNFSISAISNKLEAGNYVVTVKIYSAKEPDVVQFTKKITLVVIKATSIQYNRKQIETTVYPNPFDDAVTFGLENFENAQVQICLMKANGQVVFTDHFYNKNAPVYTYKAGSRMLPGIYVYSIMSDKNIATGSIVKK
jgi:outer membrane protein assembly factor BamB